MDTADSPLICTAWFIFIRRSGRSLACPFWGSGCLVGGLTRGAGPAPAGGRGCGGSIPPAGEATSTPEIRASSWNAALLSPAPCTGAGGWAVFMDTHQDLWRLTDETAGGWLGIDDGCWHCWLVAPAWGCKEMPLTRGRQRMLQFLHEKSPSLWIFMI